MNCWQPIFHHSFFLESAMPQLTSETFILRQQWQPIWLLCLWQQLFSSGETFLIFTAIFNISSVMNKLPPVSYLRLVDIWLISTQIVPFIEVVILTIMELYDDDEKLTINHHGFERYAKVCNYICLNWHCCLRFERIENEQIL